MLLIKIIKKYYKIIYIYPLCKYKTSTFLSTFPIEIIKRNL